ncbi:MAG: nucleotidyltransferase domain-containing protein [Candidatus Eisenbacteria bacterium]|nr:nucleotidyltransferase domain-containing protein [Candidatus Eisenbacteria bacterium]
MAQALDRVLDGFVAELSAGAGADLRAVVLFGSAAEGAVRAGSDVNLIVVLEPAEQLERFREPLRRAHALIGLRAMFAARVELPGIAESFPVKMLDVRHRHRLLFGALDLHSLVIPTNALRQGVRQSLLNLRLRLREISVRDAFSEPQALVAIRRIAGPLRACALGLAELERRRVESPRSALLDIARSLDEEERQPGSDEARSVGGWESTVLRISALRRGSDEPGQPTSDLIARVLRLTERLEQRLRSRSDPS